MAAPVGQDHWRAESDRDTLNRAAEVVADRIRLRAAMKLMRQQQRGVVRMIGVLSGQRRNRMNGNISSS